MMETAGAGRKQTPITAELVAWRFKPPISPETEISG